jgi:hypothetical protein
LTEFLHSNQVFEYKPGRSLPEHCQPADFIEKGAASLAEGTWLKKWGSDRQKDYRTTNSWSAEPTEASESVYISSSEAETE